MMFEDAMASLGDELGLPLEVADDVAEFEVTFGEGEPEPMSVAITYIGDGFSVVLSADVGELPEEGQEELMMRMLEANHLFDGTGGAALSVEGGRAKLERRVRLHDIGRGEGANVVRPFLCKARYWADVIAGRH